MDWQILGSNDGISFTTIFDSLGTNFWPGGVRDQVLRFDEGVDYPLQTEGFSTFRYRVLDSVGGSEHALSEIEYFGEPAIIIPEPSTLALILPVALAALRRTRRKLHYAFPAARADSL